MRRWDPEVCCLCSQRLHDPQRSDKMHLWTKYRLNPWSLKHKTRGDRFLMGVQRQIRVWGEGCTHKSKSWPRDHENCTPLRCGHHSFQCHCCLLYPLAACGTRFIIMPESAPSIWEQIASVDRRCKGCHSESNVIIPNVQLLRKSSNGYSLSLNTKAQPLISVYVKYSMNLVSVNLFKILYIY